MWRGNRIRRIVRLTQMLKRWRKKASISQVPADVPPGHVAVNVGMNGRRFIIRASYLNHPLFQNLLRKAEEEFGFDNNEGPICIPCDESMFEETLRVVARSDNLPSVCRVKDSISLPLLRSIPEKSIC
ncbi:indole-3-acetic acid-induced protein ARG7-like [Amaranthus tricolor]|uniref:indole-3-acetic acid-induced protein ARG7-like n=1 Tax=Amaranthus tricolor TaxID=29722 RepID=UPI0025869B60|nr:indole-3-acetic acid-induced protein ARG7-like [Amaranthus tricolor]